MSHAPEKVAIEPWVDIKAIAAHTGISTMTLTKMAASGQIPSYELPCGGKRIHRRFKLSLVDEALLRRMNEATPISPKSRVTRRPPLI